MTLPIEDITTLVRLQLGLKEIAPNNRLIEELGAESADVVNIIAAIEEKYNIFIGEEELINIHTVADLHRLVQDRV